MNLNQELAVIKVNGFDSAKFLQGQLTNDINELTSSLTNNCLSYHLNHKGRMFANFIVMKPEAETFYLITNKEIIPTIIARLKMFILRAKVEIGILEKNILLTDSQPNEDCINIKLDNQNFLIITDKAFPFKDKDLLWNKFIIDYGFTLVRTNTLEQLIPQQANLDLLHGINFTKGCYTGQEIVARTHYLGKIKRRLFRFELSSTSPIEIGQNVVSPKFDNQEVGIIVEVVKSDNDAYLGLVSMQIDCQDSVFLDLENKNKLLITEINYESL